MGINHATPAVRFERRLNAGFFLGRQGRRLIVDGLNEVTAGE
jgi:hypothetical protein